MRKLMVRLSLIVAIGIALGAASLGNAAACWIEPTSPGPANVESEIKTLQITVTDGGFAIRPQVAPGRYEVMIENLSGQDIAVELVQLSAQSRVEVVYAGFAEAHGRDSMVVDLALGRWVVRSAGQGGSFAAVLNVSAAA